MIDDIKNQGDLRDARPEPAWYVHGCIPNQHDCKPQKALKKTAMTSWANEKMSQAIGSTKSKNHKHINLIVCQEPLVERHAQQGIEDMEEVANVIAGTQRVELSAFRLERRVIAHQKYDLLIVLALITSCEEVSTT